MCFKKKAKKSITVTPNPEYCIWVIPTDDLAYNAVVDIGSGCQLLYIVNGQLRSKEQARRVVVNPKKEKRAANKITLIGVNFNKVFEIMCGAGNIPYKDREIGAETVVGISADMKVRIRDGWKLYTMFGNKNITEQEVNELIRSKCAEILSQCKALLRSAGSSAKHISAYLNIPSWLPRIARMWNNSLACLISTAMPSPSL